MLENSGVNVLEVFEDLIVVFDDGFESLHFELEGPHLGLEPGVLDDWCHGEVRGLPGLPHTCRSIKSTCQL